MKGALIILSSFNIKKFETNKCEFKYLRKNIYVEFHHFYNFLYSNLINVLKYQIVKKKYANCFDPISKWKEYILSLRKKFPNSFVFSLLNKGQYIELLISYLIKKLNIKKINILLSGFSENENLSLRFYLLNNFQKLLSLYHLKFYFVQTKITLINYFQKKLNLNVDFILPFNYSLEIEGNDKSIKIFNKYLNFKIYSYSTGQTLNGLKIPSVTKVMKGTIFAKKHIVLVIKNSPFYLIFQCGSLKGKVSLKGTKNNIFILQFFLMEYDELKEELDNSKKFF